MKNRMIFAPAQSREFQPPRHRFASRRMGPARSSVLAALIGWGAGAGLYAEANLLVDPAGQAFFAGQDGVYRINAGADQVERLPIALDATRLLFDAAGNLCGLHMRYDTGADLWRPAVWRYRHGEAGIISDKEAADAFAFAEVTDEDGRLYFRTFDPVNETSRLLVREKGNEVALLAGNHLGARDGRGAAARLGRIGAMTVARDRHLYFTDGGAVRKVSRDGLVTTVAQGGLLAGTAGGRANPLAAIAVDENRNIYVADDEHRRLLCIDAAGTVNRFAEYDSSWVVAGLAVDRGSVFALEKDSTDTRVRRWTAGRPADTLPVYSAGGTPLTRSSSANLEQRSILDSPLFHGPTILTAARKQLPDPNQPE